MEYALEPEWRSGQKKRCSRKMTLGPIGRYCQILKMFTVQANIQEVVIVEMLKSFHGL